ncbi:hypothetical protein [Candidatus Clostridium stratigraminis]|uniref:Uncharacterized protein n=1 Tax=Candidatus Clostridium stratigraminis TaxID=3381661 RepID=A0ABW8T634_9CLOT
MMLKNSKVEIHSNIHQVCLDCESLIFCLTADYFLIQRGIVPFASALYFILLNDLRDKIYKQNLLSVKRKLSKEDRVIMTNADKNYTKEDYLQFKGIFDFCKSDTTITDENFTNGDNTQNNEENFFNNSDATTTNKNFTNGNNTQNNEENFFNNSDANTTDENFTNDGNTQTDKVYFFDKSNMSISNEDFTKENNFQYNKTYYFDKSGIPIDEHEGHKIRSKCKKIIKTCCLIQLPRGFKLTDFSPAICFNLGGLSCIKNPLIQKVTLPALECEHPKKCEVVAGYEIRAVGEVNFSVSIPIYPIDGFCYPTHSHICGSSSVPVNENISHTCCPKPCNCNEPCVEWTYAYFNAALLENECGSYIKVKIGVALEYKGECECDEE